MDKVFTKENIFIVVAVFILVAQSNYFATKLDLANIKLEMAQMQQELKLYTDTSNKEILQDVDNKFQILTAKIDKIRGY